MRVAKELSAWTKERLFEVAAAAAFAAALVSCASTYWALESLPEADSRAVAVAGHGLMLAAIGVLYGAHWVERHRRDSADAKILEDDEFFALVARGSADGIALTDASGRIQMANPAFEAMFAAAAGGLQGAQVSSLLESTMMDEWITNRLDEPDCVAAVPRTVTATRIDGQQFTADLMVTPQALGPKEFLTIAVRDVTEREVSRLKLKHHETLLREIPEPLMILDGAGRIVYWNVGAENLYGFSAGEAIGQTANDLLKIVPPEGDGDNVHALDYGSAPRWTGELRAASRQGRGLRIERRRTLVSDGDTALGEVIFDLDLGQRSRHDSVQRRRQRLESLGTLASGITHDLNNLLTPILMSSRMLQRGGDRLDRDALLETIVSAASRGAELISQLLTFAGGGEGQHGPVNVSDLFDEVSQILKHTLGNYTNLTIEVEPELPQIMADATEISQVIMNLAINARDAMPAGGELSISARRFSLAAERTYSLVTLQPGQYVAICVSDEGTGIPESIRDRIFDPFFSTKERGQGTGLGLSTSLGIIRGHGGAIEVKSSVGKGTSMTVILPVAELSESEAV